jgi:hypothetical protein
MSDDHVVATEKALLFLAIGYLEALKCRAIHFDEVFHTIGAPRIFDAMKRFGISPSVAALISQLDEVDPDLFEGAHEAIEEVLRACREQLSRRPLIPDRANVCLKLLQPSQPEVR